MRNFDLPMEKLILERRSVRTFDGRELTVEDKEKLCNYLASIDNPYGLPIEFKLLPKMSCPVVVGTNMYVGAKIKDAPHLECYTVSRVDKHPKI